MLLSCLHVEHAREPARGRDPARVDEAVEEAGLDVERAARVVRDVVVLEVVRDEVEGLAVVRDLGVEPGEVEAVEDVVLLDLAEVLVPLRGQEPRDPLQAGAVSCHVRGLEQGGGRTELGAGQMASDERCAACTHFE
jgi:hypothetical protein